MIEKESVVEWFKDLESFKRIEIMCTLLNMCLPFELRFLGTFLEELGRRDSQELRVMELRVNNPIELLSDIVSCQKKSPSDMKIRRKMALYLALIRAINRPCVNELFKTLDEWGDGDFNKFGDGFEELLLVYTMATNHPVFSFEQRMKCGEIFLKIDKSKCGQEQYQEQQINDQSSLHHHTSSSSLSPPPLSTASSSSLLQPSASSEQISPSQIPQLPQHNSIQTPPPQQSLASAVINQQTLPPGQQIPIQMIPQGTPITTMGFAQIPQMIASESGHIEGQMLPPQMIMTPDFSVAPPNTYWAMRHTMPPTASTSASATAIQSQQQLPTTLDAMSFPPPQSSSPHLSQQSTPGNSRTGSPTRIHQQQIHHQMQQQQQQQQLRTNSQRTNVRTNRRPSDAETPPPQQQTIMQPSADMIKSYNEEVMINADAMTQLQQLCRNGYRPQHHTLPRQSNKNSYLQHQHIQQQLQQQQQQQQQHQQMQGHPPPIPHSNNTFSSGGIVYTLQNMTLMDVNHVVENNRQKSGESDSGSSVGSIGEISPPETPSLVGGGGGSSGSGTNRTIYKQQQQLGRINGRQGKLIYPPNANSPQQQLYTTQAGDFVLAESHILASNNNSLNGGNNGSNNNTTVLLTGLPSGVNNVVAFQQQPQFSNTYPYHSSGQRPPITIPPPQQQFRQPAFQIQPNGEILYPYPPQLTPVTAVTFIQQPVSAIRTTPQHQQQQQLPPQQQQPQQTILVNKNVLSCFNCGSQNHVGRDCQDPSMEDVTRNSIYKLDYSEQDLLAAAAAATSSQFNDADAATNTTGNSSNSSK